MTVRVERTVVLPVSCERVWDFISDPENRARAISVVERFEPHDTDSGRATWFVTLPILGIEMAVHTREVSRNPPTHVKFAGRSKAMDVIGEHNLEEIDGDCQLTNLFIVDGRLPGVERFFRKNLDSELDNLERMLHEELVHDP